MGEWTREEFDEQLACAKQSSTDALMKFGQVRMISLVFANVNTETRAREPHVFVLAIPKLSEDMKPHLEKVLLEACREADADGIITCCEAWIRRVEAKFVREKFPDAPREDEGFDHWLNANYDRVRPLIEPVEALQLIAEFGRRVEQHTMIFTRDEEGNPVPGEWISQGAQLSGRFANLLPGARGN